MMPYEKGLPKSAHLWQEIKAYIHMPRIGCVLAGGTWDQIEPPAITGLVEAKVETFVYD